MTQLKKQSVEVWVSQWPEYQLLDSGDKQKLERIGTVTIIRSEPRAWWQKDLPEKEWDKAVAKYEREERGQWTFAKGLAPKFVVPFQNLKAKINFTKTSKHIGLFPEQSTQWEYISKKISSQKKEVTVLNLFGYTGMGSLAAASGGAKVTHVDGSKVAMTWARENQHLSGLEEKPIRWILDDAVKFIKREVRRGARYDAILMDPPAYGHGPQGQVWKLENNLAELLDLTRQLLSPKPLFVLLTMYAIEASSLSVANLLADMTKNLGGSIQAGELALPHQASDKLLPMSIFGLWEN
jgi:23S rRNA (cytosine1962-C5)-methyltransferase